MLTRRYLNRLADHHSNAANSKAPLTVQKVAKAVGDMRAQIRRTYDNDAKLRKLNDRVKMLEHQSTQSEILAQMYREKIDYLVDAWPILRGIVKDETDVPSKDAPVWAFHTLSSAYFELTLENVRILELKEAIQDATSEVLRLEMDVCELHTDMASIAKIYNGTNAWQAFPYEACAECLSRTSFCSTGIE